MAWRIVFASIFFEKCYKLNLLVTYSLISLISLSEYRPTLYGGRWTLCISNCSWKNSNPRWRGQKLSTNAARCQNNKRCHASDWKEYPLPLCELAWRLKIERKLCQVWNSSPLQICEKLQLSCLQWSRKNRCARRTEVDKNRGRVKLRQHPSLCPSRGCSQGT